MSNSCRAFAIWFDIQNIIEMGAIFPSFPTDPTVQWNHPDFEDILYYFCWGQEKSASHVPAFFHKTHGKSWDIITWNPIGFMWLV